MIGLSLLTRKNAPKEDVKKKVKVIFIEPVNIMMVDTVDNAGAEDSKLNYDDQEAKAYTKAEE